jgi:hypothetical protein
MTTPNVPRLLRSTSGMRWPSGYGQIETNVNYFLRPSYTDSLSRFERSYSDLMHNAWSRGTKGLSMATKRERPNWWTERLMDALLTDNLSRKVEDR